MGGGEGGWMVVTAAMAMVAAVMAEVVVMAVEEMVMAVEETAEEDVEEGRGRRVHGGAAGAVRKAMEGAADWVERARVVVRARVEVGKAMAVGARARVAGARAMLAAAWDAEAGVVGPSKRRAPRQG